MILPDYLQDGDTIAIAAPARKISYPELVPAIHMIEQQGYNVFFDERLFAQESQFAGSDEVRAEYFQNLIDNPNIKAIWCARGGYGSVRLIDRINFSNFVEKPKWVCGYSDITVFHSHIHRHFNIATLHAIMPINIHEGEEGRMAIRTFFAALRGRKLIYTIPSHPLNQPSNLCAPVVGGNLSVLYSMIGSPSDVDTTGKILFIEDLDEYLYHIDRMMTNLERNGKLQNLAGILVGHLSDMHDNTISFGKNAEEIVAEYAAKYNIPIIFNFPAGHLPDNRTIRLGCPLHITCMPNFITIEN